MLNFTLTSDDKSDQVAFTVLRIIETKGIDSRRPGCTQY
jgi:hypothetical protein